MIYATSLRCRECKREYPLEPIHVCEFCFGPVEVAYDYEAIRPRHQRESIERGPASLWRYAPFLPVEPGISHRPSGRLHTAAARG